MAAAAATRRFDVFLSHNSRDKPAVKRLAEDLKRAGLEPWLDVWCLTPGGRWQEELAQGLHESSACAVFVGPSDIGAWEHQELSVALDIAAKDPGFRIFLVLLPGLPEPFDPTVLSPFLSTRTWVDLRPGIASKRAFQALVNAIKGVPFGTAEPVARSDDAPPYRGLQSFDEGDAELFFGREADTQRLVEKLKAAPFLAVLGRSGSGKSSLVRAGLVPALRAGVLAGSEDWRIELLRPGGRPLEALAARAAHVQGEVPVGRVLDELAADPRALHLTAAAVLADAPPEARVVWVVDQFEEVFTLCHDQAARDAFVAALVHAASAPDGRSLVVLTMRADFYPACAAYPDLAGRVSAHQFLVGELSQEGLRSAIEEPARRVGLEFEEGLVDTIVQDVGVAPGALPLLEHALLELWERRRGSMLTLEGYRESGGVQGALAERADAVFSALTPEQQAMARRALLRLTQPGEGTEDTRRRAGMDELAGGRADEPAVAAVVQSLVSARLLTTTSDEEDGEAEVEVAHEALIRGWPRLRHWIDEDRAGLRIQHRLSEAAHEWETLGRDEGLLYRGARLAEAREWRQRNPDEPNLLEVAFLDASIEARDREARAAEARRRKEVRLLRTVVAVLLGGAAVAGIAALVAWQQRSDAVRQKRDAQEQRAEALRQKRVAQEQQRIGRSRELAATSALQLSGDPIASLRTAVQAVDTAHTAQATEALRQALAEAPLVYRTRVRDQVLGVGFDPSGRRLLVEPFAEDHLYVLDAGTGRRIGDLGNQTSISWAPPEQSVGLGGDRRVRISKRGTQLLDATGHQIARLPLGKGCSQGTSVAFTPDGRRLVTCIDGPSPAVYSALTGERLRRLPRGIGLEDTSLTVGVGNRGLDYGVGRTLLRVDLATGSATRHRLPPAGRLAVFAAAGNGLGLASGRKRVAVVDFRTGRAVSVLSEPMGSAASFAFSPDRRIVAVAPSPLGRNVPLVPGEDVPTNEGQVDVFDVRTGGLLRSFVAGAGAVGTLAYSADGRLLLSAGSDGVVRLWPRTGGELLGSFRAGGRQDVVAAFSPDGRRVAVAAEDGSVHVWRLPLPAARAVLRPAASPVGRLKSVSFAGRGLLAAAVGPRGALAYDTASGRIVATLAADDLRGASVSADGRRIAILTPGDNTTLRVFELPGSRALMRTVMGDVTGVWLSADGRRVATRAILGGDAWNVGGTRPIAAVSPKTAVGGDTSDTGLSADGRFLAVTRTSTGVTVVDLETGRKVTVGEDAKLFTPVFSQDDRLVYAIRDNGALWAYDWRNGGAEQVLASQEASSRVSPHVSAGGFTTERFADRVAVIELASRRQVELLGPFPAGLRAAQISADGTRVVVLTKDGTLHVFGCQTCAGLPSLLAEARRRTVGRP